MLQHLNLLYQIANKPTRTIIGLMSGTSLDGLDIALCQISKSGLNTKVKLLHFETVAYDTDFKNEILSVFAKRSADLQKVCLLNAWIGLQHAQMINQTIEKWNINKKDVDLIASHGQTIYHAPKILHRDPKFGNATLQIGDGDHIAHQTGIITISDFRQKHIAAGGQGAPLAVYGDYLVFSKLGENRIMLNIGGIANFTFLPATINPNEVFSTDVGAGNTMMDAFVQRHFAPNQYDQNAMLAMKGTVDEALLEALGQNDFFEKPFPKTTGPELFNLDYLQKALQTLPKNQLSNEDILTTLNQFSADMIVSAIQKCLKTNQHYTLYASGGGMHNPLLMKRIADQLPHCEIKTTADLEINPDAKEAVLFALLANECVAGTASEAQKNQDSLAFNVSMGKISLPH